MKRVLVLGANGQVGCHLREVLPDATCWDRSILDVSDPARVEPAVLAFRPDVIVNAAAYTAVDRAESEADLAWRVNAEAPAALARAAHALDVPLVHISTDYVFDGTSKRPYRETDPVGPINVYGRSKLAGELAVASLCTRYWILRTSWVFSEHGTNFVKTILRLARLQRVLTVVDDQHGCPTYAGDLAELISRLVSTSQNSTRYGLYHVCGGTPTTWRGFADSILAGAAVVGLLEQIPEVRSILTSEYPTAARRPQFSMLNQTKLLETHTGVCSNWQAGLDKALARLRELEESEIRR